MNPSQGAASPSNGGQANLNSLSGSKMDHSRSFFRDTFVTNSSILSSIRKMAERTILLVEDEALVALAEKKSLEDYGYHVLSVRRGEKAVEAVRHTPGIDLILMDINLGKGMDGTEAAQAILKDHDIPIIFLSSHTARDIVERTEHITSYGYVVKDSGITVLDASIKMALKLHEAHEKLRAREEELRESEHKYRTVVDFSDDWEFWINPAGEFVYVSPSCERITGYGPEEFEGDPSLLLAITHPDDRHVVEDHLRDGSTEHSLSVYFRIIDRSGGIRWISHRCRSVFDSRGDFAGIRGSNRDVTERRKLEDVVWESERKFRSLYESMTELSALHEIIYDDAGAAVDYRILDCNPAFTAITGIGREHAIGKPASRVYESPEAPFLDIYARVADTGEPVRFEAYFAPMKKYFSISAFSPEKGYFATIAGDITHHKQAEDIVKASLREKEILLRETHHRVKNNLAVISSILNLQSMTVHDPEARRVLSECRQRVNTMGMIHTKLHQSHDTARIDFGPHVRELMRSLSMSHATHPDTAIKVHADEVFLDIDTSIPLSLIINELVTNALKYAFPDGKKGEIAVTLLCKDGSLILTVSDNGIGLPEDVDLRETESLGMQLVVALVEQLEGNIEIQGKGGTEFRITLEA